MAPKLYYFEMSAPARSVLLTAKALSLELELVPVNLAASEHLQPGFLKMNPQHSIPTLDDDGYYLWDSHAINTYLVGKYGKDDSLYPKDLKKRGIVDQRLHFDSSIIQAQMRAVIRPIIHDGVTSIPKEKEADIIEAYNFLEAFLEGDNYMAGDHLTIADFALAATISSISPLVPLTEKHARLIAWFGRVKALPYYKEVNQNGADTLVAFLKSKLV